MLSLKSRESALRAAGWRGSGYRIFDETINHCAGSDGHRARRSLLALRLLQAAMACWNPFVGSVRCF
jgi:hypothetical protein